MAGGAEAGKPDCVCGDKERFHTIQGDRDDKIVTRCCVFGCKCLRYRPVTPIKEDDDG